MLYNTTYITQLGDHYIIILCVTLKAFASLHTCTQQIITLHTFVNMEVITLSRYTDGVT